MDLNKLAEQAEELYNFTVVLEEFAESQYNKHLLTEIMPFVPLTQHINNLADNLVCEFIDNGYLYPDA